MTLQPKLPWSDWLAAPAAALYKQDHRSRVWRVDPPADPSADLLADPSADLLADPSGSDSSPVVIKRFGHSPLRQRLAMCLGLHPAQHEVNNASKLIQAGVPVVPIMGMYVQPQGMIGCRVHLATAYRGVSLQQLKKDGKLPAQQARVEVMLAAIGAVAAGLLEFGWVFRDLKTANILVDEQYKPWLIDVGSARRGRPCTSSKGGHRAWRMLRMLDHTMTQDGWDTQARRNTLARALACLCPEPVDHAYDRLGRIVLK